MLLILVFFGMRILAFHSKNRNIHFSIKIEVSACIPESVSSLHHRSVFRALLSAMIFIHQSLFLLNDDKLVTICFLFSMDRIKAKILRARWD